MYVQYDLGYNTSSVYARANDAYNIMTCRLDRKWEINLCSCDAEFIRVADFGWTLFFSRQFSFVGPSRSNPSAVPHIIIMRVWYKRDRWSALSLISGTVAYILVVQLTILTRSCQIILVLPHSAEYTSVLQTRSTDHSVRLANVSLYITRDFK